MAAQAPPKYISQSIDQYLTPPRTPPPIEVEPSVFHNWPEPETEPEHYVHRQPNRHDSGIDLEADTYGTSVSHQEALLLHGVKQRYTYTTTQPIPDLKDDREMLVAVEVIGLNPIDWKAPHVSKAHWQKKWLTKTQRDFGFGLPTLPCVSGRDLAGRVIRAPAAPSRFKIGDKVLGIATDYRDSRKSAFQQYAAVPDFNACKLSPGTSTMDAAPLGVAFVAAALALGICLGMNLVSTKDDIPGPDLLRKLHSMSRDSFPEDIRNECFDGIQENERAKAGDWIAIWGGSSATGCCAVQLAKLAGLKVISIIDVARSGERMLKHGADLLVDRMDTARAISIVKGITNGKLRFGLDTQGKTTTALLADAMRTGAEGNGRRAHVVSLVGIPKEAPPGVLLHTVPIKAFHEAPAVGQSMMVWLEELLERRLILTPEIEIAEGGLQGINDALGRLRDGTVNGPRMVVPLRPQGERD